MERKNKLLSLFSIKLSSANFFLDKLNNSYFWLIHDFGDLLRINLSSFPNPTGFLSKSWMSHLFWPNYLKQLFQIYCKASTKNRHFFTSGKSADFLWALNHLSTQVKLIITIFSVDCSKSNK